MTISLPVFRFLMNFSLFISYIIDLDGRFMKDNLISEILEALIVIWGLIVQKTKLISDCNRLLKDLLDSLLIESSENKRQFIRACICGLQIHGEERKGRTSLVWLSRLICCCLFIYLFFWVKKLSSISKTPLSTF